MKTFHIETDDQRQNLFKFLSARELPFQIEFGPIREQRSLNQNSRLWALHQLASAETGYTPDEMHNLMLAKFYGVKEIQVEGAIVTVPAKRSSTRDKAEFRAFLENVENFYASEFGCWLGQDE